MTDDSTIRISKELKKKLSELGNLSDSYQTVIEKLYDCYMKHSKKKGGK